MKILIIYNKICIIKNITNEGFLMKNYYDILEINKKASKEIIENAYKTLSKKYSSYETAQDENSEKLSDILKREGVKHEVLNAKYHEKEAEIIAQAGKYGAVTIATNMAGRGTDIMLGRKLRIFSKTRNEKTGISR